MSLGRGEVSLGMRLIGETAAVRNGVGSFYADDSCGWGQTILFRSSTHCPRGTFIVISHRLCVSFQYPSQLCPYPWRSSIAAKGYHAVLQEEKAGEATSSITAPYSIVHHPGLLSLCFRHILDVARDGSCIRHQHAEKRHKLVFRYNVSQLKSAFEFIGMSKWMTGSKFNVDLLYKYCC